jgi:CheY-like chemotaxis protein
MSMVARILFADDHEDTRDMIAAALGSEGWEVATAGDCEEGLRLARAGGLDLILLDYKYEDGTGEELCRMIRRSDRSTPILFFSGLDPKLQREALSCGAQGFVLKPDFDGLRREIGRPCAKWLGAKRSTDGVLIYLPRQRLFSWRERKGRNPPHLFRIAVESSRFRTGRQRECN